MTIPVQIPVTSSVANGVTTSFPYTFKILSADDLTVTVDGEIVTTGYSVLGVGNDSGGLIEFDTAPANGLKVVRYIDPTLARTIDYQQFGDWLADIVNADFDRIWIALQCLSQALVRTLQLPVDTTTQQTITQDAAERAGKLVGFDINGDIALTVPADLDLVTVTDFIATFLLTANETDAREIINAASLGENQFTDTQKFAPRVALTLASTIDLSGGGSNTYTGTGTGVTVSTVNLDNGSWAIVTYPAGNTLQYSATTQRLNTAGQNYTTEANDTVLYFGLNGVVAGFIIPASGQPVGLATATNDPTFAAANRAVAANWLKAFLSTRTLVTTASSPYTPAGAESLTRAHGQSTTPLSAQLVLECVDADAGYAVGEKVRPAAYYNGTNANPLSVYVDATNCGVKCPTGFNVGIQNKSSGLTVIPTANKWKYFFQFTMANS